MHLEFRAGKRFSVCSEFRVSFTWRPDALTQHLGDTRHIWAISAVTHEHPCKHVDKHWLKTPRPSGWESQAREAKFRNVPFGAL